MTYCTQNMRPFTFKKILLNIPKRNTMKIILLLAVCFIQSPIQIHAKTSFIARTTTETGGAIAANTNLAALTLSMNQYWGVGKKTRKLKVGLGIRLTSTLGGRSLLYITAPAKLTSNQTGPGVFFADQVPENIDTLTIKGTQVNSLNTMLAIRYDVSRRVGLEFNIDLAGLSVGSNRNATLQYGSGVYSTREVSAHPTMANLLLISDNDLGSLNSFLNLTFQYRKNIKLTAGFSFLFSEYTIKNAPSYYTSGSGMLIENNRFRAKSLMPGLGIYYCFHRKK